MKSISGVGLKEVQGVYGGAEGKLWELIMGEQIHIGGLTSSMDLAEQAGIKAGSKGVDLCCCSGAGMRFLVRFRNVAGMMGVDATEAMVELGKQRCQQAGLADRIQFTLADVCSSGLESNSADFVWGEDAWCYVVDKNKLIAEAARIVRPGGVIAFTDWVEGKGLSQPEAERFLRFMKFANIQSIDGYCDLLKANGCEVLAAKDTGRFSPCIDLYLNMLGMQLTYDALQIIGFDQNMMQAMAAEMAFIQQLARAGKIAQGLFVAKKKG
ncbi:MAG TPA: methyltransferase domain-containing protein [Sedimentisphaerales bacterium]|nr:methyltransferase domain-containing protein [Sedimentisphaerales bacterium]